jgi:hypothetical protein
MYTKEEESIHMDGFPVGIVVGMLIKLLEGIGELALEGFAVVALGSVVGSAAPHSSGAVLAKV